MIDSDAQSWIEPIMDDGRVWKIFSNGIITEEKSSCFLTLIFDILNSDAGAYRPAHQCLSWRGS